MSKLRLGVRRGCKSCIFGHRALDLFDAEPVEKVGSKKTLAVDSRLGKTDSSNAGI